MPVTIRTQPIDGEPWLKSTTTDAHTILQTTVNTQDFFGKGLMQSSFHLPDKSASASTSPSNQPNSYGITPAMNGLVYSAVQAWNNHHHLVLRPDDIWIAILSQLGFFINAHAEEFRSFFVSHKGKTKLEVHQVGDPDNVDYAEFAKDMTGVIADSINDPAIRSWVMPDFTTTTDNDRVVASVLLMGAMQKYFNYDFCCETCGIPSVTLLGVREDWVDLAQRIDKIKDLAHEEVAVFHGLMVPLARHFVKTFDEPLSQDTLAFWRTIASRERPRYGMSGGPNELLTGWIASFCFWTEEGKLNRFQRLYEDSVVQVDAVKYWAIDPEDVIMSWGTVPVTVKWFDAGMLVEVRKCKMVAGSVGMRPGKHRDLGVSQDVREAGSPAVELGFDAVAPEVGWWIFQVGEGEEEEEEAEKEEGATVGKRTTLGTRMKWIMKCL
ncbi:protein of unknown function (DUF4419) domain containing protein [Naviculisporaceae sp. PSN 640]